jgi:hypothetical protein
MGPIAAIVDTFRKWGLLTVLDNAVKSGQCMTVSHFKSMINRLVLVTEESSFRATCLLYKSLNILDVSVQNIKMWPWWTFSHQHPEYCHKIRVMCRLLMGQNCLKVVISQYDKSAPTCTLCDLHEVENATHLLFKCSRFCQLRSARWQEIRDATPPALTAEIDNMNSERKTAFILSGFHCNYTQEWYDIYASVASFCYDMYQQRRDCQIVL